VGWMGGWALSLFLPLRGTPKPLACSRLWSISQQRAKTLGNGNILRSRKCAPARIYFLLTHECHVVELRVELISFGTWI
jgi:hypothetical protein